MSLGTVLIGIAALVVVTAYLARPFRSAERDVRDRTIEAWVGQARREASDRLEPIGPAVEPGEEPRARRDVNYCTQCGQRVDAGDRFCSHCGARLRGETR